MHRWSKYLLLSLIFFAAFALLLAIPGPSPSARQPLATSTVGTTACPSPTVYPLTISDNRGRVITIPQRPMRIVSGAALFTEVLFDIGAGSWVVGVAASPDNPAEASGLPQIGPSFQPNVEKIIALKPDLVFDVMGQARDALENAGLIVVTPVGFISHVSDILDITAVVGRVTDNCPQAQVLAGQLSEAIVRLESRVLDLERVSSAFIYASQGSPPFFAAGRGAIESELLARAGGRNVFADIQGVRQVGLESLINRDPDFIFTDPSQVKYFTGNKLLANLKAVKSGQVVGIKASSVTSTRVAQALRAMAQALHPEAFPPKSHK